MNDKSKLQIELNDRLIKLLQMQTNYDRECIFLKREKKILIVYLL